ncbi:hypothetical protein PYCC9005_001514 [Savitreella phatthalungensis]
MPNSRPQTVSRELSPEDELTEDNISENSVNQDNSNGSDSMRTRRSTRSEGKLTGRHMREILPNDSDLDEADKRTSRSRKKARDASVDSSRVRAVPLRKKLRLLKESRGTSTQASSRQSSRVGRRSTAQQRSYREPGLDDFNDDDSSNEDDDDEDDSDVYVRSSTPASGRGRPRGGTSTPRESAKPKHEFNEDYSSDWEERHWDVCETCRNKSDRTPLIYCQGCAVAIHRGCIVKHERQHQVTVIPEHASVLQCRHCLGRGGQKGGNRSYMTGRVGPLCAPFALAKSNFKATLTPEQLATLPESDRQAREEDAARIKASAEQLREQLFKPEKVMFRCQNCLRPSLYDDLTDPENADPDYEPAQCLDCNAHRNEKVHLVLGWRLLGDDKLDTIEVPKSELPEDYLREYLVKWEEKPYNQAEWVLGSWLHGVALQKKKHFDAREMDAIKDQTQVILDDWLIVDIVLDVRYAGKLSFEAMRFQSEEDSFRAIEDIEHMLVKWRQVHYDDCTWDAPPPKVLAVGDDSEQSLARRQWLAFEAAYRDYCRGFFVMIDRKAAARKTRMKEYSFNRLELKQQPKTLTGGELMDYQLEGLNWLYFKYYSSHPAILADEMGLGKTIQIISLFNILHTQWSLGPFLVVAPNSTISNWKRECQKWAPDMRVCAYYGERVARDIIEQFEMVHNDVEGKPLKVNVLITSYSCVEQSPALLRRYKWACLVVDEGQRLKNDESILFKALSDFDVNLRILLTGTPLQNNTKELFNLLQFLDPAKMNARELEDRFDIERQESLSELHKLLQPYFLRRTKAQVLKFLPKKNEVIVPVTMSSLQKSLYKSILSKNAELMRSVMSRTASGKPIQNYNQTSLGNILQQIRKILSHPFMYSPDIEEQIDDEAQAMHNLTTACAKLQLLRVLLPALKAKGHRVLIFCQFIMMLDILEDWLNALGVRHCRIDGNTPSPERQEAIDSFNRDPDITCFLLSTRAGGVGINLATADTVIIYDADFNPHQDLQAVARAHRIGQKNNVVVFTLVTRNTAEEKILQIGRKKLVLDQLIIENMATKEENVPYNEILSFGAAALFDDEEKNELVYDTTRVNALIESSYAEEAFGESSSKEGGAKDDSGEKNSFSFAKVWAGDTVAEDVAIGDSEEGNRAASDDLWSKILTERAEEAKREAEKRRDDLAKGRKRTVKDYSEAKQAKQIDEMLRKNKPSAGKSGESEDEDEEDEAMQVDEGVANTSEPEIVMDDHADSDSGVSTDDEGELESDPALPPGSTGQVVKTPAAYKTESDGFPVVTEFNGLTKETVSQTDVLANLAINGTLPLIGQREPVAPPGTAGFVSVNEVPRPIVLPARVKVDRTTEATPELAVRLGFLPEEAKYLNKDGVPKNWCKVCRNYHISGQCPLRAVPLDVCTLCGTPHLSGKKGNSAMPCPALNSTDILKQILEDLKRTNEDTELAEKAKAFVRGRIGHLQRLERDKLQLQQKPGGQGAAGVGNGATSGSPNLGSSAVAGSRSQVQPVATGSGMQSSTTMEEASARETQEAEDARQAAQQMLDDVELPSGQLPSSTRPPAVSIDHAKSG